MELLEPLGTFAPELSAAALKRYTLVTELMLGKDVDLKPTSAGPATTATRLNRD